MSWSWDWYVVDLVGVIFVDVVTKNSVLSLASFKVAFQDLGAKMHKTNKAKYI